LQTPMNLKDKAFTSFFDKESPRNKFDFITPEPKHQHDLKTSPIISGTLNCHSPYQKAIYQGHYTLHNHLLCFNTFKDTLDQTSFIKLSFAVLTPLMHNHKNQGFGFAITKQGATFEFYSPKRQTIEDWIKVLRYICISTSFNDEFSLIKSIGKGIFSKTYLAESKKDKSKITVRVFDKKSMLVSHGDKARSLMKNEVNLLNSLSHKNITQLFEVFETENSICLLLELVKGTTLQDILIKPSFVKKNVSDNKTRNIILSLLNVLSYLSSKKIVHRDIKPSNLLIEDEDNIKIIDLGLATSLKTKKYILKKCGTAGYIAPEMFKYDDHAPATMYDNRCDIFSAGCVLFLYAIRISIF